MGFDGLSGNGQAVLFGKLELTGGGWFRILISVSGLACQLRIG